MYCLGKPELDSVKYIRAHLLTPPSFTVWVWDPGTTTVNWKIFKLKIFSQENFV